MIRPSQARLGTKLRILTIGVTLLLVAAVGTVSVVRFKTFGQDRLLRKAETLAKMTAETSTFALYTRSETELRRIAQGLRADPEIAFVQFIDPSGAVVMTRTFLGDGPSPHAADLDLALISGARGSPNGVEAAAAVSGGSPLKGSDPLTDGNASSRGAGVVRVGLTRDLADADVRQYLAVVGAMALVALGIGLTLSNWVTTRLTAPIAELANATHRVAAGHLDVSFALKSDDELGELAADFTTMVERLEESHRELERRVAARTRELALATESAHELARRADEANQAKSQFLANMSHEIRTPMNGVLGMAQLLLTGPLPDPQRRQAQAIMVSAEALLGVINDILDFSKVEAGRLELEELEFEIAEVLADASEVVVPKAHAKGIELAAGVGSEVPARVFGDPNRLRQILLNLIGNAVKFTESGEVIVRVSRDREEPDSTLIRFEVHDTGIGMDAAQQANIFQAFVQADGSMTRRFGGTGLGLAISKQLIELMGGTIGVESEPGVGSRFWFTVPLRPAPARDRDLAWAALEGCSALVVDDNRTNREIVEQMLERWGVRVATAVSAVDALGQMDARAQAGNTFDVAILDLMMPEVDGAELAAAIRARWSVGCPRLLLLTSVDNGATLLSGRALVDAWITKPIRQSHLLDAMVTVLSPAVSAPVAPTGAADSVLPSSSGGTALVVDDNPINRAVLHGLLQRHGLTIVEAANGVEALVAGATARPDLVFMDLQMPLMDGLAATAEWRAREAASGGRRTPIIAVTASVLVGERDRCFAAGMDDYLAKPFKTAELESLMARWVGRLPAPTTLIQEAPPGHEPLDPEVVGNLRLPERGGSEALWRRCVTTFLEYCPDRLTELDAAVRSGAAAEAKAICHSLKSSSGMLGARTLAGLFVAAEKDAIAGRIDRLAESATRIRAEYDRVVGALAEVEVHAS